WIAGIFQGELPLRHLRPAGLWLRDRPRPYPEHREIQSIWEQDPCYDGEACPEVGLLHRCFQKLLTGQADADFPDLFGCYLRILGLAYRGVTSDPEVAGLDAFQRVYDAGSTFAQGAQPVAEEVISQEEGLRLAAVELRLGHAAALVEQARKTPRSSGEEVRKSWLFHFKRQARPKEKGPPGWLERYGRHARDATLLETTIQGSPGILERFRGLDVAGREREEPLWSIAPALLRVREASLATKPLGLTLHVGEDTPHLASGLRAIHEPFIWGLIQRGDRLGHAIALGRDPVQWALKNRQVRVPRWTRLLDLAWLHFCCGRYDLGGPAALEEEAERLQTEIFGTSDTLAAWAELWEQLGSPHFLRGTLGFPNGCPRPQGAVGLFHDYLYRQGCFVAGEEEVEVEATKHLWMVEQIQRKLLREIESWQVVIEVNPTSNWIVARTGGILDQPMYHLRPVHARPDHPSLPLALCTDDPLAFSTCLADEYAYAWAGLNGAGIPSSYAREWLRDAAEVSLRAAF
ncbi:MAG TPA: hypothetical protein PLA94_26575, partial [Myxococcota bacterium]|nr:hypothetical protein [Myxococcota bacterium]